MQSILYYIQYSSDYLSKRKVGKATTVLASHDPDLTLNLAHTRTLTPIRTLSPVALRVFGSLTGCSFRASQAGSYGRRKKLQKTENLFEPGRAISSHSRIDFRKFEKKHLILVPASLLRGRHPKMKRDS